VIRDGIFDRMFPSDFRLNPIPWFIKVTYCVPGKCFVFQEARFRFVSGGDKKLKTAEIRIIHYHIAGLQRKYCCKWRKGMLIFRRLDQ